MGVEFDLSITVRSTGNCFSVGACGLQDMIKATKQNIFKTFHQRNNS